MSLTESELDRLADYTVDVLEPRDAAEVAHLVRTDARWADAYRALVGADVAVRAELRSLGGTAEPMPADVAARIDLALAELRSTSGTAEPHRAAASPVTRTASVTSLDAARARRRRLRTSLGLAAAAVAVVGGGFAVFGHSLIPVTSSSTASRGMADNAGQPAAAAPEAQPPAPGGAAPAAGIRAQSSGTDYRLDTLGQLAQSGYAAAQNSGTLKAGDIPRTVAEAAPGPLTRLTGSDALAACLGAVLVRHPGTVTALDYARFAGEPALVIVVRQVAGTVVVAVGDGCGISGSDEKAAVAAP